MAQLNGIGKKTIRYAYQFLIILSGQLRFHFHEWQNLTSDANILSVAQGCNIECASTPCQCSVPKNKFSPSETHIVKTLIQGLLQKGVIQESFHEEGEFILPIVIRSKKNGKYRFILNLKNLDKYVSYQHFKMDTITSCLHLI